MKSFILIFLAAFAASIMAEETNVQQVLKNSNEQFTAKMFDKVAKKNPSKSFVISAYSVLTPLAQIALASVGESHDELLNIIGMPNDNVTKTAFSYAISQLRSVKDVTLKTASKVYVANRYELNTEFATVTREIFESEVENVDFVQNEETAKLINEWVEEQTNNRIKNLVDPSEVGPDTRAVLVNAIYFKGLWKQPFRKYSTTERDFYVTKDNVIKVQMMNQNSYFKYAENQELKAQVLEIPYEGDEASLVVILPAGIDGIYELEENLKDPSVLDKALNDLYKTEVDVYLPRFKIETTTDLKEILQAMNVNKMFSSATARLENLLKNTDDLYISDAKQKAFIEVNEEGAEAAAANFFGVSYATSVNYRPPTPVFNANRPFYFLIRTSSSSTLFNGIMRG